MKIICYSRYQFKFCKYFLSLQTNDQIKYIHCDTFDKNRPEKADLIITDTWQSRAHNLIHSTYNRLGIPNYTIGAGYVRKFIKDKEYLSISKSGLKGNGKFRYSENYPDWRVNQLDLNLKPWKTDGKYILLGWQHFSELYGNQKAYEYFFKILRQCKKLDRPVIVRIRPGVKIDNHVHINNLRNAGYTIQDGNDVHITKALEDAYFSITYDSNFCVDSIINGVPCVVGGRTVLNPNGEIIMNSPNIHDIRTPDREQWLRWLAWQQWNIKEMKSGEAWRFYIKNDRSPWSL